MTLTEIKSMFQPGQQWHCLREAAAIIVNGNCGQVILPNKNPDTVRTVERLAVKDLVWKMPDGKSLYSPWPKAGDVLEARAGFLKFKYPGTKTGQNGQLERCPERDIICTFNLR
jgi:hypothetical protein